MGSVFSVYKVTMEGLVFLRHAENNHFVAEDKSCVICMLLDQAKKHYEKKENELKDLIKTLKEKNDILTEESITGTSLALQNFIKCGAQAKLIEDELQKKVEEIEALKKSQAEEREKFGLTRNTLLAKIHRLELNLAVIRNQVAESSDEELGSSRESLLTQPEPFTI